MINKKDLYRVLERTADSGLIQVQKKDMVSLAVAIWHEGFVPDTNWVKQLDNKSQRVVGYMAEFFAGFNVLCHEEREALLVFSAQLKNNIPVVEKDEYRDALATEWGLENDLTKYFEDIAHYQTRHYVHTSDYKRPSANFVL